jgi:hypothetical protein
MALTIINEPTAGGRLGAAVGSGISGLLENLVQNKAQQIKQANDARGYQAAWKLSPEQAQFAASQSPEWQQKFVNALQSQQQAQAFRNEIGGQQPSLGGMQANIQSQGGQQPSLEQSLGAMGGNQDPQNAIAMNLQKLLPQLLQQAQRGQPASIPQESLSAVGPQNMEQNQRPQGQQPQQSIADIMGGQPLNPQLQAQAENIKEKRRSTDIKERTGSFDRVKDDIKKVKDRGETARRNIHDLELVKKLNKSGQLKQGFKRDLAEKFGLENWYTNEPTEVASKLLERQKQGAASAYGSSRMTNFLLDSYSKQLGRLVNTPEGLDAILDNRINEEKGYVIVADEMNKLQRDIEKNRDLYPFDIESIAYQNVRPKLDALAQEDVKRIDEVIAKDNQKIVKALPPAAAHKGQSKINASRGIKATSDGNQWVITPLE